MIWPWVRKWFLNHIVIVGFALPSAAITFACQFVFLILLHWTGWLAFLGTMLTAAVGLEYSNLTAMFTRAKIKVLGRPYSYAPEEKK